MARPLAAVVEKALGKTVLLNVSVKCTVGIQALPPRQRLHSSAISERHVRMARMSRAVSVNALSALAPQPGSLTSFGVPPCGESPQLRFERWD